MAESSGITQNDDILRVAAYHRVDFEVALLRSPSRDHEPIRASIVEPFSSSDTCSTAGTLQCLPLEILRAICLELDIQSYFHLRQTNRRTREFVSSVYEYHLVALHALECLRSVLRTGITPHVSLSDLYHVLCTSACAVCGSEFGGILFLPSITRCCYGCLVKSKQLSMISVASLVKCTGISRTELDQLLPILHTVPGNYSMEQRSRKSRVTLVSFQQAYDVLTSFDFLPFTTAQILSRANKVEIGRFMASTTMPSFNPATLEIQHGVCCKGCQVVVEEDTDSKSLDIYSRRDKVYSKEGFLDHFWKCPQSVTLWEKSESGTVSFDEPEVTKRRGFLSHLRD